MTPEIFEFVRLLPLGFAVGVYGTLVGAGGGAILVPVLLFMLPHESAASLTSISLVVVFFNAYSGTLAYMRMGRINYFAGALFAVAGIPGAILGAMLVHHVTRAAFDPIFGALLLGIGAFLAINPLGNPQSGGANQTQARVNFRLGSIGSAYIAVFSSMLGLGGGIIHVPFLIRVLRMPPHNATATSHFVLTFMALTATIVHLCMGEFHEGIHRAAYLAIGVMMGAPLGAAISAKIRGSLIVRMLAVALCVVGVRLIGKLI